MVAVKAEMRDYQNPREMIEAINLCEQRLKKSFPQVMWSFFEPDVRN